VDEKYTSAEARRLREDGSREDEDALAAMLLLQSYLDQP
jgi:RNase H-fold protein (predicted Holliday junction resolvase)